jgi:peptidoglycan hydrolase CwlO-like protein
MASQSDDVTRLYAEIKNLSTKVDNLVTLVNSQQKYIDKLEINIGSFRKGLERFLHSFKELFGGANE